MAKKKNLFSRLNLKNHQGLILGLIIIFVLVEIFLIYFYVSKPHLSTWDESGYVLEGYIFRLLIKKGDWSGFWDYTRHLVRKPFLHSWYLSLTTLPFNYTVAITRLVNLLLLIPTVLVLWFLALEIDRKKISLRILSIGLVITSPMILFIFSTAMREGLALLLSLLALWLYILGRKRGKLIFFFLASFSCLGIFFIKYHYLLYILGALMIESAIWFFSKKNYRKSKVWFSLLALFSPLAIISLIWVFLPAGNWEIIRNFMVKFGGVYRPTFITHTFFYFFEMAFSYTFSWLAFLILLPGFLIALIKHRRDLTVRTLALAFLINFFLTLRYVHKNQARYLFTTFPIFFLIGSLGIIDLWPSIKKFLKEPLYQGIALILGVVALLVMVYGLISVPVMLKPTASHQWGAAIFYEQDYQNMNYRGIGGRFDFNRRDWPQQPPPADHEKIEDAMAFVTQNVDVSKRVTPLNSINELSPHLFYFYIEKARQEEERFLKTDQYSQYYVFFGIIPEGRFDTWDYRAFNYQSAERAKSSLIDPGLEQVNQKEFPYLGLTVTILGKKTN